MAVVSRDELMNRIKARIGEDTSDDALSLIEDFSDTFTDYESRAGEDWKAKYDELDSTWRKKYRDRFFQTSGDKETTRDEVVDDNKEDLESESKEKSFEDLFEEKEDNSGY